MVNHHQSPMFPLYFPNVSPFLLPVFVQLFGPVQFVVQEELFEGHDVPGRQQVRQQLRALEPRRHGLEEGAHRGGTAAPDQNARVRLLPTVTKRGLATQRGEVGPTGPGG